MAPEHKFDSAAKICSELLTAFADGILPLEHAAEVLRDALAILASKEVKVMIFSSFSASNVEVREAP